MGSTAQLLVAPAMRQGVREARGVFVTGATLSPRPHPVLQEHCWLTAMWITVQGCGPAVAGDTHCVQQLPLPVLTPLLALAVELEHASWIVQAAAAIQSGFR